MQKRLKNLLFLGLMLFVGASEAKLTIQITEGLEGAQPIAVVPFGWAGKGELPEDVAAIVAADLARSGRFAPLERSRLPAQPHDGAQVAFNTWRSSGSDALVIGQVREQEGRYQIQFQLFDVLRGEQLAGYQVPAEAAQLRQVAHKISDIIYEKLTGERGAFDTHIAYVTLERGRDKQATYRLAVADADGYNEQVVLTSGQPLMSPAWSPEGKRLAYVSFEEGRSIVYVQTVASGQREAVAAYKGLNSAPAWSPDGQRLALTLSRDGNSEIYLLRLSDKALTRLTNSYAIDTEPTWSPDGTHLLFTSDRGGRPQLYELKIGRNGADGRPRRITFEGSYNAKGTYSPDGRYVAMVHRGGDGYRIAVLDRENGNLRVLTKSRLDESPSFAPNGSMIIYATETSGTGVLEAVSVDGRAHQRLGLSRGDVREPAWSPFTTR